jgi:hypothetical protein
VTRTQTPDAGPARYMQGIAVPASSVRPTEFFARTRRKIQTEYAKPFAGAGQTDIVELKKTDILAGLILRFDGQVVTAKGTGAVNSTARWPYDLFKNVRFTANGQTNIINVSGAKLKAREMMAHDDLTDRGVIQTVNGTAVGHGTLAKASESWGVGTRTANIADGTYDIDLDVFVPIAEDQVDLAGAIFAATSSTDLTLGVDWAPINELFQLSGTATATLTGQFQIIAIRYAIPLGNDGQIVVPDLSLFHSLLQTRHTDSGTGVNEKRLVGQGAGKTLLRVFGQLWNGASPQAPVIPTEDTFGVMAWRYSGNETPDEYRDGQVLRIINERMYNCDIANVHGFFSHEFAQENAFRDAIDLSNTAEWRLLYELLPAVALTNPALEVVAETIFQAGSGS